jgi:hypothetical protein
MFGRRNHDDKYRNDRSVIPDNYDGGGMSSGSRRAEQWIVGAAALPRPVAGTGMRRHELCDGRLLFRATFAMQRELRPAVLDILRETALRMTAEHMDQQTTELVGERSEFTRLEGRNVAATLAHYISDTEATEVVVGHRHRARWRPWDTTSELIRRLAGVDVHILRVSGQAV